MATEGNIVLLGVSVFVLAAVGFSFMLHMRKFLRMLLVGAGLAAGVTLGVVALVRLQSGRPKRSALGGSGGLVPNNQACAVRTNDIPLRPPLRVDDDRLSSLNSSAPPHIAGPMRDDGIRNFNREQSEWYIAGRGGFRHLENLSMANPCRQVRLNLGEAFERYMIDSEFQRRVNALVLDPRTQIWSDVWTLDLTATQVRDINPLAALTNLTSLFLSGTQVENLSPLAALTNLDFLSLARTQVHDISPLARLINLQVLYLHETQVENITALAGLTRLQDLSLFDTQVTDIRALAGLTRLQDLSLSRTQVNDITPLTGLTNLRKLYLSCPRVQDIRPLTRLTNLEGLFLFHTRVRDITPLAGMTNLQNLDLAYTQVQDIRTLAGLPHLQELDLSGTRVSDIRPLAGLQHLRLLGVRNAPNVDLTPLDTFASLDRLQVDRPSSPTPIATRSVPAQLTRVANTPAHTQIVTELPANVNDRECKICCEAVVTDDTLGNFVKMGNHGTSLCCRACIIGMQTAAHNRGREVDCPYCRVPLGPLPF